MGCIYGFIKKKWLTRSRSHCTIPCPGEWYHSMNYLNEERDGSIGTCCLRRDTWTTLYGHTGKPNSPFLAKHHPFQAQTTRSRHANLVLGLILPFTAQSRPLCSVLLATRYSCSRGHQSGCGEIYQIELWGKSRNNHVLSGRLKSLMMCIFYPDLI